MTWLIYTTCADIAEAERIAEVLVTERLAACVHQLASIRATYFWEGKLCHAVEVPLLIKSTREKHDAASARIKELHSYDTPAIIAWAAEKTDPHYLAWLQEAVA